MADDLASRWTNNRNIQSWLAEVLVPVEPSALFLRRLKSRLVHYRGQRPSPWVLLPAAAMLLLLLIATLGIAMRILLGLFGLIGIVRTRKARQLPTSYA